MAKVIYFNFTLTKIIIIMIITIITNPFGEKTDRGDVVILKTTLYDTELRGEKIISISALFQPSQLCQRKSQFDTVGL